MKPRIIIAIVLSVGGFSVLAVYATSTSNPYTSPPYQIQDQSIGTVVRMAIDSNGNVTAENNFGILHGQKLYLDSGHAGGNQTYFWVPPGKTDIAFVAYNGESMDFFSNRVLIPGAGVNFVMTPTAKLILDGDSGGNNYITNGGTSTNVAIFSNGIQTITANNGQVGIGTPSPGQKLDVSGTIRTGNLTSSSTSEFKITAPSGVPICIGSC